LIFSFPFFWPSGSFFLGSPWLVRLWSTAQEPRDLGVSKLFHGSLFFPYSKCMIYAFFFSRGASLQLYPEAALPVPPLVLNLWIKQAPAGATRLFSALSSLPFPRRTGLFLRCWSFFFVLTANVGAGYPLCVRPQHVPPPPLSGLPLWAFFFSGCSFFSEFFFRRSAFHDEPVPTA